jgi:hypothetical protein
MGSETNSRGDFRLYILRIEFKYYVIILKHSSIIKYNFFSLEGIKLECSENEIHAPCACKYNI